VQRDNTQCLSLLCKKACGLQPLQQVLAEVLTVITAGPADACGTLQYTRHIC
jgi:hypothetical protein